MHIIIIMHEEQTSLMTRLCSPLNTFQEIINWKYDLFYRYILTNTLLLVNYFYYWYGIWNNKNKYQGCICNKQCNKPCHNNTWMSTNMYIWRIFIYIEFIVINKKNGDKYFYQFLKKSKSSKYDIHLYDHGGTN